MNLEQIIENLKLEEITINSEALALTPTGVYCSDLLSCVMAGAQHKGIWVTLQAHNNIVAVGALLDLSAIIITEGAIPEQSTIEKAKEEGMTLLSTSLKSFEVCGRLWEMGLRG
jgi:hypothetical protein